MSRRPTRRVQPHELIIAPTGEGCNNALMNQVVKRGPNRAWAMAIRYATQKAFNFSDTDFNFKSLRLNASPNICRHRFLMCYKTFDEF